MAGIPALAADLRDLLRAFADHEVRFLIVVPVIGRDALLANKRALGRTRDLADVELLESSEED